MSKLTTDYLSEVANAWSKKVLNDMERALFMPPRPVPKLSRWQKFKRFMTKERSIGRWLTYKLMDHYDIYEGDW